MKSFNAQIRYFEYTANLGLAITFPAKSVIIDRGNARALILSPGPFDLQTIAQIKADYEHIDIVAPNAFHHLYLDEAAKNFPNAKIYAPQALFKKKKELASRLTPMQDLPAQIAGEIQVREVGGNPSLGEYGFFHISSQTLILTDLIFNMREPMPLLRRWTLKLAGVHNKTGQSKLVKMTIKDPELFYGSIEGLRALQPQSILLAHGDPIQGASPCQEALSLR